MSNLTRWEPMREMMTLREAMDQLFNDAFTRPINKAGVSMRPAFDLYQNLDEVVVKANLPGLKSDDVQISVTKAILTLRGEVKQETEEKEATWHLLERRYGMFERSVMLPTDVQTDKAKADFENGVLTITLPKAETVKPRSLHQSQITYSSPRKQGAPVGASVVINNAALGQRPALHQTQCGASVRPSQERSGLLDQRFK